MTLTIPSPPPDASGGFMAISYSNGTDSHKQRVHVLPFSTALFSHGTTVDGSDDGHHNYAYGTGTRSAGYEFGINDTFQAWVNLVKTFYPAAWTFSLTALYQMVSGEPVEVFPTPTPTAIAGTNAGGVLSDQDRALELIYNFRTTGGARGRIILIGPTFSSALAVPIIVTGSTGGAATEQALVAYLSGNPTGIVAHDGNKFQAQARRTAVVNRRLRRHYGFA